VLVGAAGALRQVFDGNVLVALGGLAVAAAGIVYARRPARRTLGVIALLWGAWLLLWAGSDRPRTTWDLESPGASFLPNVVAIALMGLGVWSALRNAKSPGQRERPQ
jgi:hypothetical protein